MMERPKRWRWDRFTDKIHALKRSGANDITTDTTQTLVLLLQELSETFPPLGGVAKSLLAVWNLSQVCHLICMHVHFEPLLTIAWVENKKVQA